MTQDRQQLIENAIKFLQDPQVKNSPLSKQLSFLQSKGLTQAEIEDALNKSNISSPNSEETLKRLNPSTFSPPPLPISNPPQRALQKETFNWGRFALLVALISSAGIAFSQSFLFRKIQSWINGIRLVPSNETEDLKEELKLIKENLRKTEFMLKEIEEKVRADIESMTMKQNYLYNEISNEIEELRDYKNSIETQPISINKITTENDLKEMVQ